MYVRENTQSYNVHSGQVVNLWSFDHELEAYRSELWWLADRNILESSSKIVTAILLTLKAFFVFDKIYPLQSTFNCMCKDLLMTNWYILTRNNLVCVYFIEIFINKHAPNMSQILTILSVTILTISRYLQTTPALQNQI